MELIVDANILFSALIKNGLTANFLFNENLNLYSPEFIIEEFMKYEDLILRKTSRTKEEFFEIIFMLKEIIAIIPKEEYFEYIGPAEQITPDEKDTAYFALALKLKCGLWTNDKKLKRQNIVKVYSTEDLIDIFS